MLWITQGWLIYELTGSKLLLGANALAQAIPATVLTLFGGVVADKVDMRRLVTVGEMANVLLLSVLAGLAFSQTIQVWHVIAIAFLLSVVGAFTNPGRQAMFPHLAPRQFLPSAVALNSTIHPGTRVVGPIVAGFLLAGVTDATSSAMLAASAVFCLTAMGHGVYVLFLRLIHMPPVHRATGKRFMDDLAEGIRIIWRERVFALLIGTSYYNMFWVVSMSVLFPVFAKDILNVGPSGLGFMYTFLGVGNLTGALLATNFASALGRGRAIVAGSLCLGGFVVLFALSPWYPVALVMLSLAGVGASVSNVNNQSSLQLLVRNEHRGRVMGYWGMTHTSVRPMGEMQLAALATVASAPIAVAVGGSLVVAFALLVLAPNRHLRSLNAAEEDQAAARRQGDAEGGDGRPER